LHPKAGELLSTTGAFHVKLKQGSINRDLQKKEEKRRGRARKQKDKHSLTLMPVVV